MGGGKVKNLLQAAVALRIAQQAYMADRGNEAKGKAVGEAATRLDEVIDVTYPDRVVVYQAIDGERRYQKKWENPALTDSGGKHSNVEFLVYIRDYVEEALHYATRNPDPAAHVFTRHSLRKIGALAVAAMEQNGVEERA
jgi:hypothetical protein